MEGKPSKRRRKLRPEPKPPFSSKKSKRKLEECFENVGEEDVIESPFKKRIVEKNSNKENYKEDQEVVRLPSKKIQTELSFVASAPEGPPRKPTFNHEEKTKHGSPKKNFKFTNKFSVYNNKN